jgi:hypothetical protein
MGAYDYQVLSAIPAYLTRPILALIAGANLDRSPSGLSISYGSNLFYRTRPAVWQSLYAIPFSLAKIPQGIETWTAAYALATDLGVIRSITSRSVVTFLEGIRSNADAILKRWREERRQLPAHIPPPPWNRDRWDHVRRVLAKPRWMLRELWPHLTGILTWTSGPCRPDAETVRALAGPEVRMFDGANAPTEGIISIPIEGPPGAGVVHPQGGILEFIPVNESIDPARLLKPWQLEKGKDYEVFMTTWMGFVRYRIKDIVRCIGRFGRMPVVSFQSKADRQVRLAIASLSEQDLVDASLACKFQLSDRTLFSPSEQFDGLVLWTSEDVSQAEVEKLDSALRQVCFTYGKTRARNLIRHIRLTRVPGTDPVFKRPFDHGQAKSRFLLLQPPDRGAGG